MPHWLPLPCAERLTPWLLELQIRLVLHQLSSMSHVLSLYFICWVQNRTFGLDLAYLVVVETNMHSLCSLLILSAVMSLLVALLAYKRTISSIMGLPTLVTPRKPLSSRPWFIMLESLGCCLRRSWSMPLFFLLSFKLNFSSPSMVWYLC